LTDRGDTHLLLEEVDLGRELIVRGHNFVCSVSRLVVKILQASDIPIHGF
jgi:hypothetical protein